MHTLLGASEESQTQTPTMTSFLLTGTLEALRLLHLARLAKKKTRRKAF